ncbi:hypothetical protein KCU77_g36, partial [Aureobasidium melanogenum]
MDVTTIVLDCSDRCVERVRESSCRTSFFEEVDGEARLSLLELVLDEVLNAIFVRVVAKRPPICKAVQTRAKRFHRRRWRISSVPTPSICPAHIQYMSPAWKLVGNYFFLMAHVAVAARRIEGEMIHASTIVVRDL